MKLFIILLCFWELQITTPFTHLSCLENWSIIFHDKIYCYFPLYFLEKNAVYVWVGGLFKYTVIPYIKYFKLLSKSSKSFLLMFVLCIFMYAFFFYWWITKCILNSNMKNGKGFLLKYSICSNKISCETDIAFLCNVCIFGCCFFQTVDFSK